MYIILYYFNITSLLYVLFSYYFSYYITAYYYFIVLFHYYFTIIPIIFTIISDYIRVSHPFFQELADANLRPMRQAMTDKCPGVPAKFWDDQGSLLNEAKCTYSAERRLFYALSLVLFLFSIVCPGFSSL